MAEIRINGKTQKGLFHDPEVGTEAHDDLLAWCASKTGSLQIAEGIVKANIPTLSPSASEPYEMNEREKLEAGWGYRTIATYLATDSGTALAAIKAAPRLEIPATGYSGFVIGFMDALINVVLTFSYTQNLYKKDAPDELVKTVEKNERVKCAILLEVKTGKIMLGEILRQMNTYKTHAQDKAEYRYGELYRALIIKQTVPPHYLEAFANEGIKVGRVSDEYELEWLN